MEICEVFAKPAWTHTLKQPGSTLSRGGLFHWDIRLFYWRDVHVISQALSLVVKID